MDQRHSSNANAGATAASPDDTFEEGLVEDLLRALSTAMRSFRLYGGESPMLGRFIDALRARLVALFEHVPVVRLHINEEEIHWEGHVVYPSGGEAATSHFCSTRTASAKSRFFPDSRTRWRTSSRC
jgi:hypothetical protein